MAAITAAGIGAGATALSTLPALTPSQQSTIVRPGQLSGVGQQAADVTQQQLGGLQDIVQAGPGARAQRQATQAQTDLAQQLQQLQQRGGVPTQQQFQTGLEQAQRRFAPQQEALEQTFTNQRQQAAQEAALLGRDTADPVLAGQLAEQQQQQEQQLRAQEISFAAQQPQRQLQFASQRADVLGGLAQQARKNREALLSSGRQVLGQERRFQARTADKLSREPGALSGLGVGGDTGIPGVGLQTAAASAIPGGGIASGVSGLF